MYEDSSFASRTLETLILLHTIAMNDTGNDVIGKFRNDSTWAYNPMYPILHTPPEHLRPGLMHLCDWINNCLPEVKNMPPSLQEEFAMSLTSNRPYMDGNKRTSRLLTNVMLHRLNLPVIEWDFNDFHLRQDYQLALAKASMKGDLPACIELHKQVPGYPKFTKGTKNEYYKLSTKRLDLHCFRGERHRNCTLVLFTWLYENTYILALSILIEFVF
jgi:Fic/DOC family